MSKKQMETKKQPAKKQENPKKQKQQTATKKTKTNNKSTVNNKAKALPVSKRIRAEDEPNPKFVQDYIPVKNIFNGIIETTDGRFVKILEIEPINFSLRAGDEQFAIISSFAGWLKISPVSLQFKSITRKADSEKYIKGLEADLKSETNERCLEVAQDYIGLIRDVGNCDALTRRFFLIFEYEPMRKADDNGLESAISALNSVEQTARQHFFYCGNSILEWKDPNMAVSEILYTFFNRRSCVNENFTDRVNRITNDMMLSKGLIPGVDEPPKIKYSNYIAPRGIDFTHRGYFIMDGLYYSVLCVKANGYPTKVRKGWTSFIVNAGDGIDVDLFFKREDKGKAIDKVSRGIRLNKSKIREKQDTNADYEELAGSIESGYYIKQSMGTYNEDLFYMSLFVTVSGATLKEMDWKKHRMIEIMKANDFDMSDCNFLQESAFKSVMPLVKLDPKMVKKTQRNVLTSTVASSYMFTSFEMSDDNGVLLGINKYNNSLCIVDIFNTKKNKNANVNILGTSGAGKTYTMLLLALRMRMRGIQDFIIAPEKGFEFKRACNAIGGSYITISPGSRDCINVMEIRHTVSPTMELIDQTDFDEMESMLAKKIQQLLIFFRLLIPDMTNEEEQLLDDALIKTYAEKGITHDNTSVYVDMEADPPIMKEMPILGDLHAQLKGNERTERLAIIISRFVTGSSQSFNQQTNVDLNNKFTVLDLSDLKGRMLPVGMMIALDFVWDKIKEDRTQRKAIFIDEIWKLIGADGNKEAAEFCLNIFKTIRGYGGAAISATQDLADFFSLDDGKYGKAIINNSKNKLILNLEPQEAEYVKDVLKLSKAEINQIARFETGNAMVISGSNKLPVKVKSSPAEHRLITTDRSDLLAQRREEAAKRGIVL